MLCVSVVFGFVEIDFVGPLYMQPALFALSATIYCDLLQIIELLGLTWFQIFEMESTISFFEFFNFYFIF